MRDEQEWPLVAHATPRTTCTAKARANTAAGDGTLSQTAPTDNQPTDTFIYDPRDPAPTAGGAMLGQGAGIVPQNDVEARPDVLVYTTAALDDDLEVTGPIQLILHVATSCAMHRLHRQARRCLSRRLGLQHFRRHPAAPL